MSALPLAGKVALVTGASGLIGSAIAKRLGSDGAHVFVHYGSNRDGAESVVAAIVAGGGTATPLHADLGLAVGPSDLIRAMDAADNGRYAGRLDVLVNNAGCFDYGTIADATDESFDLLFNVNVRAVFMLSREAARRMTTSGWGRIISIGSVFGESAPMAGLSLYCGSKFAVRGFTRGWSRDLGAAGITVNNVQPALIDAEPPPTEGPSFDSMQRMTSVQRFGKATDIARAVAFLAHPDASFITGESLNVDGGWMA